MDAPSYISGDNSSEVSVIDTATNRVTRTIDVGKTPHGLAMTPDGRELLVGVYGDDKVAFVDTASNTVVGSVPVAKPHTIAVRPDGQVAYVASQEPGKFALVVVDLAARSVLRTVALDKPPRDPEFSADGRALYFTARRHQRGPGAGPGVGQDRGADSDRRVAAHRGSVP